MAMRKPVAISLIAATALVGIFALSLYGGEEEEDEEEKLPVQQSQAASSAAAPSRSTPPTEKNALTPELQQLFVAAVTLSKRGDYVNGEKVLRKVLEGAEKEFGVNHGAVGEVLGNLGLLLQAQQKLVEAELVLRRSLVIEMAEYGDDSSQAGTVMSSLATILEESGRFSDAEELFRKCLEIKEKSGGANEVASAHCLLAGNLRNLGNLIEAESHYQKSIDILKSTFGESHESVQILNKTLSQFPKLHKLAEVKLMVGGKEISKADPSWSAIATEGVNLELVIVDPLTAHTDLINAEELNGKAALVIRGECSFSEKVNRCVEAGAKAVIVMSSDEAQPNAVFQMGAPEGYQSSVICCMISHTNGKDIQKLMLNGPLNIQFGRTTE